MPVGEKHTIEYTEKSNKIIQQKKINGTKEISHHDGRQSGNRIAVFCGSLCCYFSNTSMVERKSNCENLLPLQ